MNKNQISNINNNLLSLDFSGICVDPIGVPQIIKFFNIDEHGKLEKINNEENKFKEGLKHNEPF